MEKVSIDDVDDEPNPLGVHSVRRPIGRELGLTDFAMNYFELEPGESFSGGLHTHYDQEEVFYIQKGTATFDTDEEPVTVSAGEAIRFAPGDFQHGKNEGDERVVGLAMGAPGAMHDWDQIESMVPCRACGDETAHGLDLTSDGAFELTCTQCGNAFTIG